MKERVERPTPVSSDLPELESLNVDDLDVEELERRIELSSAVVSQDVWICDCYGRYSPEPEPI